jgi:pimeloyl-ACP methyl ester carboxylesterase
MAPRFAALCLLLVAALLSACGGAKGSGDERHTYTSPSGASVAYRLLLPAAQVRTGRQVLLLHRKGADASVWDGFGEQLAGLGYTVLMPTLPAEGGPETVLEMARGLWRESAPERSGAFHAVIGEGDASLVALEIAASEATIGATVLLSPMMKAGKFDALDRMRAFEQCPVLLVAAENDTGASTTAMQLKDAAPAFCELALYPGTARGADLFAIRPAAMTQVSDWLELILGKQSGAV